MYIPAPMGKRGRPWRYDHARKVFPDGEAVTWPSFSSAPSSASPTARRRPSSRTSWKGLSLPTSPWPATPCTIWTPNLKVPVWELDLEGLAIREAELFLPDFLDPGVDGWLVLPEVLEARWRALPEEKRESLPRWWTTWDVATVWLRVWPEGRVRFLGTLGEVCPEEAARELEAEVSNAPT
ncbi:hypothetical protein TthTF19_24200 (plasmid) [Thermus thermophilus]